MATIEVDFDVYKALTAMRPNEATTYNDVLRDLLKLGDQDRLELTAADATGCYMQGVHFPEGTQFRVTYKGRTYNAKIKGRHWIDEDGNIRRSPSDAATAITGSNVNGWRFWSFKRPGDAGWQKMRALQEG